jgi:hypothetical protein
VTAREGARAENLFRRRLLALYIERSANKVINLDRYDLPLSQSKGLKGPHRTAATGHRVTPGSGRG